MLIPEDEREEAERKRRIAEQCRRETEKSKREETVKAALWKFRQEKAEFEGRSVPVDSDQRNPDTILGEMLRDDAPLLIRCGDCMTAEEKTIRWFQENHTRICRCHPYHSRERSQRFLAALGEAIDQWQQYYLWDPVQ